MAEKSSPTVTDQSSTISPDLLMDSLISADLLRTDELIDLLQQERIALRDRNVEQMTKLLTLKTDLLANLAQNRQQRSDLLIREGFSVDAEGIQSFFNAQQTERAHHYHECWSQLEKQLDQCNSMNEINAKISHRSQQTTKHILGILTGNGQHLELYSAKGISSDSKDSQTIAKA